MINIGQRKYTLELIKDLFDNSDSGCILLSNEIKNREVKVKCKCGKEFKRRLDVLINGKYLFCKTCCNKIITEGLKLDIDELKKETLEISSCELVSNEYKNNRTKLSFRCLCGEIFNTSWGEFKGANKKCCNKCSNLNRETLDTVKSFIYNNTNLEVLSETYTTLHNKLKLKCECGQEFYATFREIRDRNVRRCEKCRGHKSTLELYIEEILEKNNIEYISQYKYKDCKNINQLPFDYYLPKYNLLIEMDGQQHFVPHRFSKDINKFADQLYNDAIKNSYCEDNNIPLLRIPYFEIKKSESMIIKEINKQVNTEITTESNKSVAS